MQFDIPVSSDLHQLLQAAAALRGRSVNDFVLEAVTETSQRVLAGELALPLSDRDRDRFVTMLDSPPPPNAALIDAARRYTVA